jgi:hypothetical protein
MIDVVVGKQQAEFRIGPHVFPATAAECRAIGAALAEGGPLTRVLEEEDYAWTLGDRWRLGPPWLEEDPSYDRRNRVVLHCDGKKWHLLMDEAIALGKQFTAAADALEGST